VAKQLDRKDGAGRDQPSAALLDQLYEVVVSRRGADPAVSHSARLLSRGAAKVAQKFGEEAVECLIEGAAGNRAALVGESADVLYHLIVMWVAAGATPGEVWAELARRSNTSGIAEKAGRVAEFETAPQAQPKPKAKVRAAKAKSKTKARPKAKVKAKWKPKI
jgi:phosphoribosyl-ATP pyrophosphohydrolase